MLFCVLCSLLAGGGLQGADTLRIATYNLDNYLAATVPGRTAKSTEAKSAICEALRAIRADVLALQELGSREAFEELGQRLRENRLDYPFREFVSGPDTNNHLAVLSRFPITGKRSRTNEAFLLHGRRFRMSRGFCEVDIRPNPDYQFTLIAAHLKSRRASFEADEAELRLEEARLLRARIDTLLAGQPGLNLVVLGDLNDTKNSASTRMIVGRGKNRLFDTSPAELGGEPGGKGRHQPINWTYYYAAEDTYSRIDYVLLSSGMAREWLREESRVAAFPEWGTASDHRPVVAGFVAEDR
jgi:endonuclease/exonuclease/phosphatase family metal-dependent hydrolase